MKLRNQIAAACLSFAALGTAHAATETFSGVINTVGAFNDVLVHSLNIGTGPVNVFGDVGSQAYSIPLSYNIPGVGLVALSFNVGALSLSQVALGPYTDTDLSDGFAFIGLAAGSYDLKISGTSPSSMSSYAGQITTAVPETTSIALALAGLGVVGLLASRRG